VYVAYEWWAERDCEGTAGGRANGPVYVCMSVSEDAFVNKCGDAKHGEIQGHTHTQRVNKPLANEAFMRNRPGRFSFADFTVLYF